MLCHAEVENIKELLTHEVYDVQSSGNITTGMYSRWNLVQQIMHQPFDFIQNDNRLTFTSSPINSFIRLVGAPRIRLSLRPTDGTDVAVFVYLLTVDPQGKVHYVTEGMTRGYHGNKGIITSQKVSARRTVRTRNSSKGKNMISDRLRKISELPLKSNFDCTFRKKDGSYLDNNHYNMIDIHLEPVSCLLVPGTSMRVAICGCDHDNFDLSRLKNNLATSWELQYSNQVQSNNGCVLALPIASSQAIKQ